MQVKTIFSYFIKKDDPLHIKFLYYVKKKHRQIIPYVEKCIHLGNMLY